MHDSISKSFIFNFVNCLIYVACISEFDASSSSCSPAVFVFSDVASRSQQKSVERESSSSSE